MTLLRQVASFTPLRVPRYDSEMRKIEIEYSILILAFNIHFIDLEILISAFLYFIFNFCKLGNGVPTHLISSVGQIEY